MSRSTTRPAVSVAPRPLWQIRLAKELPRYLLCAVSVAGLAASARLAIAPPGPGAPPAAPPAPAQLDRAAEGYAALFARRYLSWKAAEPQASTRELEAFSGPELEPDAGLQLPTTGQQRVEWAEVVQAREPVPGTHVYTVAAQTVPAGMLYLTVGVIRTPAGLALAGYPAFVGAPASAQAPAPGRLREVHEPALATVVQRALHNYLAASAGELDADLTSAARVSLPAMPLSLESIQRVGWCPDGRSVAAVVEADDGRGVQYTLAYELDVVREQGRWEVAAVQMDPAA